MSEDEKKEFTMDFLEEALSMFGDTPDFSDQEWAALCEEAPMTQELFDSCAAACAEAGNILEFFELFQRWPDFGEVWCSQLDKELDAWDAYLESQGTEPKRLTDEDIQARWTAFKGRVRDELGGNIADNLVDDILSI